MKSVQLTSFLPLILGLALMHKVKAQPAFVSASGVVRESFNAMSTGTALPTGWRVNTAAGGGTTALAFGSGATSVTQATNGGTPTTGGSYNWGTSAGTDRAVGFMASGNFAIPNAVLVNYRNTTGATITSVTVTYKLERYRINSDAFSAALYSSTTGAGGSWTAQSGGAVSTAVFSPGASSYTFATPTTIYKTVTITGLNIAANGDLYFMWVFGGGSTNGQGIGLDDVVLQAGTGTANVIASLKDVLSNDANSNGVPNPGDKITYNTTIRNNGNGNAASTTYTNPLPANTAASGTPRTSALAVDDPLYIQTVQGGTLTVAAGTGVLANDFGQPTLTVASFGNSSNTGGTIANGSNTITSDNGATVTMNTAGLFTYNAVFISGFAGYDRFGYTATTGNAPDNDAIVTIAVGAAPNAVADGYSVTGNVDITVSAAQGILNNDAGSNRAVAAVNGSSANVGANLTLTQGGVVNVAVDGSFTYQPPAGFEGTETFTYDVDNGFSAPSTATVTLTVSGMIWFVNNAAGTNGNGTLASPFNSLTNFQNVNNGTGNNPAANDDIFLYESATAYSGNLVLLAGQKLIGQDAASPLATLAGVTVPTYSAALPVMNTGGNATTITSGSGTAITLGNGNALHGFTVGNAGTTAIAGTSFGTLTGSDVIINTNTQALVLATGTANITFSSVSSSGGANGISLTTVGGTTSINGGSLTGNGGVPFLVSGGAGTVTYAGSITKTTAGNLVSVQNKTGGTVTFSGLLSASTSSSGISLASNTGATIVFSGGMNLSTGANTAFNATGGGTISATQNNTTIVNTLETTTGTALNVANTTIGASDITFRSISAGTTSSGPASGIVLSGTGALGGLVITGDAGTSNNSSGGTIQKTSGPGISLTATQDVVLDQMNIQNTFRSGISGTGVVNFTLINSTINKSGLDASNNAVDVGAGGVDVSNIAFNSGLTTGTNNLSGNVIITGNTLTNHWYHGIDIYNTRGTISDANISNNVITSAPLLSQTKGSGIRFIAFGDAGGVPSISKAILNLNNIHTIAGPCIQVQGGNANSASAPAGVYGSAGFPIAITNNTATSFSASDLTNVEGIIALVNGVGSGNFNISGNSVSRNTGTSISSSAFGNASVVETINNNTVVSNNTVAAQGIGVGTGGTAGFATNSPNLTTTINGNNISQTDGNGILAVTRANTAGVLNITIKNNTVAAPLSGVRQGIRVDAGNSSSTDDDVCLDISGNTSASSIGQPAALGIGLRKQGTVAGINAFGIEGMSAASSPGIESYVNGLNPNGGGTLLISAASGFSNCSSAP